MAADLHIHAMRGVTEEDLGCFFRNNLGSKWFAIGTFRCPASPDCSHWKAVMASPNVWVGEVSWLKAALTGSSGFIPEPVQAVAEAIGEDLPVLDPALKEKILTAAATPNDRAAGYETTTDLSAGLDEHQGQQLFTVSW